MQSSAYIGIALLIGVAMSIYLPMNSSVSRYLGSSIAATVTFKKNSGGRPGRCRSLSVDRLMAGA
jgi:hypothetical protein